jgi:hypothetical protein
MVWLPAQGTLPDEPLLHGCAVRAFTCLTKLVSPRGQALLGTHKPPSDSLDRLCPARGSADPAIPEFHPDPDAEDGSTTDTLVRGPVDALTR